MSGRHPITRLIIEWARRSAVSDNRNEIDVQDLLCGFLAATLTDENGRREIPSLIVGKGTEVKWPEQVKLLFEKARSQEDPGEMTIAPHLRPVIWAVHRRSPSLDPEHLIPAILAMDAPIVKTLRALNLHEPLGPGEPTKLIRRLCEAAEAARGLEERLNRVVLGQETAVRMLAEAYFQATLGIGSGGGPRGIFTFLGPPGVGKTLLAETFAQALAEAEGAPYAFRRFDMSLYAGPQQHEELFGSPQVYSGAQAGALTGFVAENPRSVLLFDEIEKAHYNTIQALLAVLDKGIAVDKNLRDPVHFEQCFLIFTTNLGREYFGSPNRSGFLRDVSYSQAFVFEILASAKRYYEIGQAQAMPALPPEFVSRLAKGGAVLFRRLETHHLLDLVRKSLSDLASESSERAGLGLPKVILDEPVPLLFLMSLIPNIDARQVVARSRSLAVELIQRTVRDCLHDIRKANPEHFDILLQAGEEAKNYLRDRFDEIEIRLLLVDDDDYLPGFISAQCSEYKPNIRHIRSDCDIEREVSRFEPTLVLLDLSIDESKSSSRVEKGLSVLERIRAARPGLPVYLFSEHPEMRQDFDRVVHQVLSRGGARGYFPFRGTLEDKWQADDFADKLREVFKEVQTALVLSEARRAHKTLNLRITLRWDGKNVVGTVDHVREQVVVRAEDVAATFRFAGIPAETLDDVVGLKRAKRRLAEVARWLRRPQDLAQFGISPPRGFLLAGPPGTGKTFLARCFAGEARLPFIALAAGELKSKWLGESEERVREVFERAREYAPAIVFVDELDSIGLARGGEGAYHEGTRGILTQLLACMDGLQVGEAPVFVLGATNRVEDLDPALLRPGRFDEVIPLDIPNAEARRTFFERRLRGRMEGEADLTLLIARTSGMTPAELDRIVREAAYRAAGEGRQWITLDDLEWARRLVRFGAQHEEMEVREEERRRTAWHEAGHAVVHRKCFPGLKIDYLTILPHERGALGFMAWLQDETRYDLTRAEVKQRLQVLLAGQEAERLVGDGSANDQVTTGASSDLKIATSLAWKAVAEWGMDEEVGPLVVHAIPLEFRTGMGDILRERVQRWLVEARQGARKILSEERTALERLARVLYERETLEGTEVEEALAGSP